MKPAICSVCGKSAIENLTSNKGDWVEFQDYDQNSSDSLSHPKGLEYFCGEHLSVAMGYANMDSSEALKQLKIMYPCNKNEESKLTHKRAWWKIWIGN